MKHKITISINAEILKWIDKRVKTEMSKSCSHGLKYCTDIIYDRKIL